MFAIVKNNEVEQLVQEGTQFIVNWVTYPSNWYQLATPEEKTALGAMEVVFGEKPDERFYWVSGTAPTIVNGVVEINYTSTPKLLNDTPVVDKNGQPVYVPATTTQSIQTGLKTQYINQIRDTAWKMLQPTDYMDSRKANDPSYTPPSAWLTWRAAVRTQATTQIAAITACTTVEQLIPLTTVTWPTQP